MQRISIILVLLIIATLNAAAQDPSDYRLSKNLVIKNVQIISKAGASPILGDIVIENGIITEIGRSTKAPNDAELIQGDSLFAYPSFIDAYSHTAVPKPEKKEDLPKVKNPGQPGYDRAGITPNRLVEEQLDITDKSVEEMRKLGFGISHCVPRGGMISGQGSIILLTDKNQSPFIKKNISMNGSMKSARGRIYPSTVIGVMAKYRDLVTQARNSQTHENKYESNPVGLTRPNHDREIQALYPTLAGKQKYFMQGEEAKDIHRIIELNNSLKLPLVIAELKEANSALEKIKSNNLTVLVSLDLPDTIKMEKVDSTKAPDPKREALIKRKQESISNYHNNTKAIIEKGIPFAFSFLNVKAKDIPKNLEMIRKTGASDEAVLSALTTDAAKILGISNVAGSLEKGKFGNIILTTGLLFEEDRHIAYNIVEGIAYKNEKKTKKPTKENSEAGSLSGSWVLVASLGDNDQSGTLVLNEIDGNISGTITSTEGIDSDINDASWNGNRLSFNFDSEVDQTEVNMQVDVRVSFDSMIGTIMIGPLGSFPLEGSKSPSPKK